MTDYPRDHDPYLDLRTGILRNLVGAATKNELDRAEADLVAQRGVELKRRPAKATFDLDHLRRIHRHLFQDLYDWAGQPRTVDIAKGGTGFMPMAMFHHAVPYSFDGLAQDPDLKSRRLSTFVNSAARHLDAVNHLHPFREGNGRTQRVFFDQLAQRAGFRINWQAVDPETNIQASRDGEAGLRTMLAQITSSSTPGHRERLQHRKDQGAPFDSGKNDPEDEDEF